MWMISARLASFVARNLSKAAQQIAVKAAYPAATLAARKLHVSSTQRSAEISSILEERILGVAPKADLEETGRVLTLLTKFIFTDVPSNSKRNML